MACGCSKVPAPANEGNYEAVMSRAAAGETMPYETAKLEGLLRQYPDLDFDAWTERKRAFSEDVVAYLALLEAPTPLEQFFLDYWLAFDDLLDCRGDICQARKDKFARLYHDSWLKAYPNRGTTWLANHTA